MSDIIWSIVGILTGCGLMFALIKGFRLQQREEAETDKVIQRLAEIERERVETEIKEKKEQVDEMDPNEKISVFNNILNQFKEEGDKK